MIQLLELTYRSFSITAITMRKSLVKKMGNICEQIENFSREMESIKKTNGNSSTKKCDTKLRHLMDTFKRRPNTKEE